MRAARATCCCEPTHRDDATRRAAGCRYHAPAAGRRAASTVCCAGGDFPTVTMTPRWAPGALGQANPPAASGVPPLSSNSGLPEFSYGIVSWHGVLPCHAANSPALKQPAVVVLGAVALFLLTADADAVAYYTRIDAVFPAALAAYDADGRHRDTAAFAWTLLRPSTADARPRRTHWRRLRHR